MLPNVYARRISSCATSGWILALVTMICLSLPERASAQQTGFFDPSSSSFAIVPGGIRQVQGKFPASVPVILWWKGCKEDAPNQSTLSTDDTATYTLTVAAPGLTLSSVTRVGDCKLTATLTIDPAAASAGSFVVNVLENIPAHPAQGRRPLLPPKSRTAATPC